MRLEVPPTWSVVHNPETGPQRLMFTEPKLKATLTVYTAPAGSQATWTDNVLAATRKWALDEKYTDTTFETTDATLGETPAKCVTTGYVYHSGCGFTSAPFKSIDTMVLKDNKVYHVQLQTSVDEYTKDKAMFDGILAAVQFNSATAVSKR